MTVLGWVFGGVWIVGGLTMGVLGVRHSVDEAGVSRSEAGLIVLAVALMAPFVVIGAVAFGACWLIGRLALLRSTP